MTNNDYQIKKRDVLYQGFLTVVRYHLRQRLFNNGWSDEFTREVMEHQSAAAILPYHANTDRVVLIEQFRVGALADPKSPWIYEIVAGICKDNNAVEEVVKSEAKEEAGCDINEIIFICDYLTSPGWSNESIKIFCGKLEKDFVDGIYGLPEENENIRAFSLPAEEAFEWVQEGRIKTSPAIIALQWLELNRERIRQLWQTK